MKIINISPWFLLLLLYGCSSDEPNQPSPVKVQGQIRIRNQNLTEVLVTFWTKAAGDQAAETVTDKAGKFSVQVPPGTYKVTLSPIPIRGGKPIDTGPTNSKQNIPTEYRTFQGTTIEVEVPKQGLKEITLP